jgi:uncharacterized membrane protein YfcA
MDTDPKRRLSRNTPLKIVEYIIAITTVVGGLFLLSPLVTIPLPGVGDPEIVKQILSRPGIIGLGIVAVIAGAAHGIGLFREKFTLRSFGLFVNVLVRIYAILAGWLINGDIPLPFSPDVVLLFIVIVLWLTLRLEKWTAQSKTEKQERQQRLRAAGIEDDG